MTDYANMVRQLMLQPQPVAENPFARRNAVNPMFGTEGAVRPYAGGSVYRGVAGGIGRETATRPAPGSQPGDMGGGTYVTPMRSLAESYGGGPKASVKDGTRAVHEYRIPHTPPENVAYVHGGAKSRGPGSNVTIQDGTGRELYHGPWKTMEIESALAKHPQIKTVVGRPDSIGLNQISIRDPSWLK
jgi:hypothetical protein